MDDNVVSDPRQTESPVKQDDTEGLEVARIEKERREKNPIWYCKLIAERPKTTFCK